MALLGENGAGKSTLVKILAGLEQPGRGIDRNRRPGVEAALGRPGAGRRGRLCRAGAQHRRTTVGRRERVSRRRQFWLAAVRRREWLGPPRPILPGWASAEIDPLTSAGSLTVGERQLVEIARLLSRKSRVAILDEPTAALSEIEIERVERAVKELAAQGCAVVYVTHRLREVFRLSQRVTILRNGKSYPSASTSDLTVEQLIERMLGRRLDQMFPRNGDDPRTGRGVGRKRRDGRASPAGVDRGPARRDSGAGWPGGQRGRPRSSGCSPD